MSVCVCRVDSRALVGGVPSCSVVDVTIPRVVPSFTEFYRLLPSFTEFLPGFAGTLVSLERLR